jgi:hypothetical protein
LKSYPPASFTYIGLCFVGKVGDRKTLHSRLYCLVSRLDLHRLRTMISTRPTDQPQHILLPSVLGPIASQGEGVDAVYEADVLSAECRVIGLNPYGCVSAGSLTLSAVVFNARLQPRTEPHSKLHGESPPIASPAGTFSSTAAALVVDAAESWIRIQCVLSRLSLDHNR